MSSFYGKLFTVGRFKQLASAIESNKTEGNALVVLVVVFLITIGLESRRV